MIITHSNPTSSPNEEVVDFKSSEYIHSLDVALVFTFTQQSIAYVQLKNGNSVDVLSLTCYYPNYEG